MAKKILTPVRAKKLPKRPANRRPGVDSQLSEGTLMGGKNGDGDAGPEFLPGSVLLEDLNMLAADAEALGLRVVLH